MRISYRFYQSVATILTWQSVSGVYFRSCSFQTCFLAALILEGVMTLGESSSNSQDGLPQVEEQIVKLK